MEPKKDEFSSSDNNISGNRQEGDRIISDFKRPATSFGGPAAANSPSQTSDATNTTTSPSNFNDSAAPANSTPVNDIPSAAVVSNQTPPHKTSKVFLAVMTLVLLVLIGGGVYALYALKPSSTTSTAATTTVKKDIPNIRYATVNSGWDKFYPNIDVSSSYEESNRQIFEGLVRYENRSQIVPLLATGWKNPDPTTWVFTLKQGVKFHSGRTMTADDVKASFDAMKGTDMGGVFADTIASVTVDSPTQITIKTTNPDATLLNKLTSLYVFDTKSGKQNDPINGTGAFTIKPGTTGSINSLELVAFDQYHGGRPYVRSISFIGLSETDKAKAYGSYKADLMTLTNEDPTAAGARKFTQVPLKPLGVQMMPLNTLKAGTPLANIKVRQALAESIDPNAIAKARGVQITPATQLVPQAIPGYNPNIKAQTVANPTAAKQALAAAGFPKGFTMKLTYYSLIQAEAAEIAKEAAAAGITVTLDPQSDPSKLTAIAYSGKTDAFLVTQTSDILDSSDILSAFDDTANYHNQTVIDLVTKAQSTLDTAKRIAYLQQANKAMADDTGVIPLFTQADKNSIIYDPSYVIQRDLENNDLGINFWKVYAK